MRMPLMPKNTGPPAAPTKPEPKFDSLIASAFVLDFLYPNGAAALLRRFRPANSPIQPFNGEQKTLAFTTRLYTSSARDQSDETDPSECLSGVANDALDSQRRSADSTGRGTRLGSVPAKSGHGRQEWSNLQELSLGESGNPNGQEGIPSDGFNEAEHWGVQGLQRLMASGHTTLYDHVWSLYRGLPAAEQDNLRTKVLLHLSCSGRPVEATRVCELFALYSVEEWTNPLLEAAIKARLMFQDLPAAQAIFATALKERHLGQGLDPIVVYGLSTSNWSLILDSWTLYETCMESSTGLRLATSFPALSAMPDFAAKIAQLWEFAEESNREQPELRLLNKVWSLLILVADRSLFSFSASDAVVITDHVNDVEVYAAFLYHCVDRNWTKLAADVYRKWRRLPGASMRAPILRRMVEIFYRENNATGMHQVLEDWRNSRHLTVPMHLKSYQLLIAFYARRGALPLVKELSSEYLKQHKWAKMDTSVISALLQAHAVVGDCDGALEVLEETAAISGFPPTTVHWNILLDSFAKNKDYEGGVKAFARLCEEHQPDQRSFGIIMGMAGSRGDLDFTLELLGLSKDMGVRPNVAMLDTLVEAYCQNDRFEEAELLCAKTSSNHDMEGEHTSLWNTLIQHHARRRDLPAVNRLLETMSKQSIRYDEETYRNLLLALVLCRQAHHALHFMRLAIQDNIFEPTINHYVLLMSAFVQTGESRMAIIANNLIWKKFPRSAARMTGVIQAMGKMKVSARNAEWGIDRAEFVNKALWAFRGSIGKANKKPEGDVHETSSQYSQILFLLIQMRDFATVQEIISLYNQQFPHMGTPGSIPISLLSKIMLADFHDDKYDRVKSTWRLLLDRVEKAGQSASVSAAGNGRSRKQPRISPSYQYALNDALKTMQLVYQAENDPSGLVSLIGEVRAKGFKLDSKNWNYYVQSLARLSRWKEAFEICERELMAQWTGWKLLRHKQDVKNLLPIQLRRLGSNPKRPRPISHTLLVLARVYIDLQRITYWSDDASRMFEEITKTCPRTVKALNGLLGGLSAEDKKVLKDGLLPYATGSTAAEVEPTEVLEPAAEETEETTSHGGYDTSYESYDESEHGRDAEEEPVKVPVKERQESFPWRKPWSKADRLNSQEWKKRIPPGTDPFDQVFGQLGAVAGDKTGRRPDDRAPRRQTLDNTAFLELESALESAFAPDMGRRRDKKDKDKPPEEQW